MRKIFYIVLSLSFIHSLSTDARADQLHKVKKGETLYNIAKDSGVSIKQLKKANNLQSSMIHPGDAITIPTKLKSKDQAKINEELVNPHLTNGNQNPPIPTLEKNLTIHIVEKGENLYKISSKFGISVGELKKINNLSRNTLQIGQALLVPSVENEEELPDAIEESEDGVDMAAKSEPATMEVGAVEGGSKEGQSSQPDNDLAENKNSENITTELVEVKEEPSLINVARDYLGVPYRFGGSTLRGIDCSAFVQKVFRYFSIDLPRTAREQFKAGVKISKRELRIGDLIFFKTYARYPSHVGIYIGEGQMIHASSRSKKVTISSINEPYYVRRYIGAVRLPEDPSSFSLESIPALTSN